MNITNTGTDPVFLLDRQTVDETTSKPFQVLGSHRDLVFTFTGEGTITSGNVLIEESDLPSYTGTWSQIATQAAATVSAGVKLCTHVEIGAGMWVRARINTAIGGGGTITVTVSGA